MRNAVVYRQLNDLRIDHDHLHFRRVRVEDDRHDQCIDEDRLARSGSAGDQKMGHLGDIRYNDPPGDVLADHIGKFGLVLPEFLRIDQLLEIDHGGLLIRNFDPDRGLPWDRGFDTYVGSRKVQLDIICKVRDLGYLRSKLRHQFIPGDAGTAADVGHLGVDSEGSQDLLQFGGSFSKLIVTHAASIPRDPLKKIRGRKLIGRLLHFFHFLLLDLSGNGINFLLGLGLRHADLAGILFRFLSGS